LYNNFNLDLFNRTFIIETNRINAVIKFLNNKNINSENQINIFLDVIEEKINLPFVSENFKEELLQAKMIYNSF